MTIYKHALQDRTGHAFLTAAGSVLVAWLASTELRENGVPYEPFGKYREKLEKGIKPEVFFIGWPEETAALEACMIRFSPRDSGICDLLEAWPVGTGARQLEGIKLAEFIRETGPGRGLAALIEVLRNER